MFYVTEAADYFLIHFIGQLLAMLGTLVQTDISTSVGWTVLIEMSQQL